MQKKVWVTCPAERDGTLLHLNLTASNKVKVPFQITFSGSVPITALTASNKVKSFLFRLLFQEVSLSLPKKVRNVDQNPTQYNQVVALEMVRGLKEMH